MEDLTYQIIMWALGIIATLLAGGNIFQWITLKSYKRMKNAEAYQAEIDALRKIIETNQAEIGRLAKRVEDYDRREIENANRYNTLYEQYYNLKTEFETYKINHK